MSKKYISAAFMLLFALAWAGSTIYILFHAANRMIGFHPVILLTKPVWLLIGAVSIVLLFTQNRIFAYSGLLGTAIQALIYYSIPAIWTWAYDYHIWQSEDSILPAIQQMTNLPHSSPGEFFGSVYEHTNLTPVVGFTWYSTNTNTVAPNGIFYGLNVNGIPHVRVEKVRNGWLGLAYSSNNPSNIINEIGNSVPYRATRNPNIWIWNTGGG